MKKRTTTLLLMGLMAAGATSAAQLDTLLDNMAADEPAAQDRVLAEPDMGPIRSGAKPPSGVDLSIWDSEQFQKEFLAS